MPAEIDYQAGTLAAEPKASQPVDEKAAFGHEDVDRGVGEVEVYEGLPTPDELEGENALRRVSAPIPWTVYTVAFVELCERFSYYGTQVVCMYLHCFRSAYFRYSRTYNPQFPTLSTAHFPAESSPVPTPKREPADPLIKAFLELWEKEQQQQTG